MPRGYFCLIECFLFLNGSIRQTSIDQKRWKKRKKCSWKYRCIGYLSSRSLGRLNIRARDKNELVWYVFLTIIFKHLSGTSKTFYFKKINVNLCKLHFPSLHLWPFHVFYPLKIDAIVYSNSITKLLKFSPQVKHPILPTFTSLKVALRPKFSKQLLPTPKAPGNMVPLPSHQVNESTGETLALNSTQHDEFNTQLCRNTRSGGLSIFYAAYSCAFRLSFL